uniref:GNAT family N-acetyltransferase n=1 Tax=Thaumasiovibrio occultus TaxID=1891184 RepID=UPI00131AA1CC|nr:GNAT family N-acetyltransferase [Thaumasiovibrio occultus]
MERINHLPQWREHFVTELNQAGMIRRFEAKVSEQQTGEIWLPTTISEPKKHNCYVLSPSTLILDYAVDELPKLPRVQQWLSRALLKLVATPLKWGKVDKLQVLNNHCLSTNMYPDAWEDADIKAIEQQALARAPEHALMFRSVNPTQSPQLSAALRKANWLPIVTRQVYVLSPGSKRGTDFTNDSRLAREPGWRYSRLETPAEFERAQRLYDLLYLDKYSEHNIQYTAQFMARMQQLGMMTFMGLYKHDELCAVSGFVVHDNVMTSPIFGLDTTWPQSEQLYRRMSWYTLDFAHRHQLSFNLSSGAPKYKRSRHAKPCLECSFVAVAHLPAHQRAVWKALSVLTQRFYAPMLEENQL